MKKILFLINATLQITFFLSIINLAEAKITSKYNQPKEISDYFLGQLAIYDHDYTKSHKFFKQLEGLEDQHPPYSSAYLYSLINLGKFNEAYRYSNKLKKKNLAKFESNLVLAIYHLKNEKYELALQHINNVLAKKDLGPFQVLIAKSLNSWLNFYNLDEKQAKSLLNSNTAIFQNISKIQNTFLHCYYDSSSTEKVFNDLVSDEKTNFSRYNFFFSNYLLKKEKTVEAKNVLKKSLEKNSRNLILNQLQLDLQFSKKAVNNLFDCQNLSHITAEILYVVSNALSSQSNYLASNFYLNLARYLNPNFVSYEMLLAENYRQLKNFKKSETLYGEISDKGFFYSWHSSRQIAFIKIQENKKEDALDFLTKKYSNIKNPDVYQTFEYALFLTNNDKFKDSIKFFTQVLNLINKDHSLYPSAKEMRGTAFDKIGDWAKAENDLINSIDADPNQAYVINYLAYSWIEKGIKISESLKMLEKANNLKKNDGYIVDYLGWALFKLKKFNESKKYLQQAVILMPSDPIINDHYGDALWMSGKKIQARYYWNYVLKLDKTEKKIKDIINNKLVSGPTISN